METGEQLGIRALSVDRARLVGGVTPLFLTAPQPTWS
jgi:hypothetical protein